MQLARHSILINFIIWKNDYNSVRELFMRIGSDRTVILICSVERDRLRERDRQARAMMSVQAEQAAAGGGPDTRHHHHHHHNHVHHHHSNNIHVSTPNLFRGGPIRVSTFSIYFPSTGETVFPPLAVSNVTRLYGVIDYFFRNIQRMYWFSLENGIYVDVCFIFI